MRKVTQIAINNFMADRPRKIRNTEVVINPDSTVMALYGNEIAYRDNGPGRTLHVTDAGWPTVTTRERLNGLPGVGVCQRKGLQYLNGMLWDGNKVEVPVPNSQKAILSIDKVGRKYRANLSEIIGGKPQQMQLGTFTSKIDAFEEALARTTLPCIIIAE